MASHGTEIARQPNRPWYGLGYQTTKDYNFLSDQIKIYNFFYNLEIQFLANIFRPTNKIRPQNFSQIS